MIPYEINGLPAHVLVLHAVVVLVPLTSLLVVGTAFWSAARRRLGVAVPILALVTLGAVQLTINAGGWLIRRVPITPLVRADPGRPTTGPGTVHTQTLTRATTAPTGRRSTLATGVAGVAMIAALAAGVGATVQCYRVGDAGARAVWTDNFSTQPLPRTPPPST